MGKPLLDAGDFGRVEMLPAVWREWAAGWNFFKAFELTESGGLSRDREPVEILVGFRSDQAVFLHREIRVARVDDGILSEVPCQVFEEVKRGPERMCRIIFIGSAKPNQKQRYLVFYGNPDAELPEYPSDLIARGEGVALEIENAFFKAKLSSQTGQLERLTLKREHGLELFSGGEGHGEPPGIDWAHDYVDAGSFQKLRISLWDECPDYEVIRGPLCVIVRRWGFPYSPVHPVFSPSRLNIEVEYRFYAGLPWFQKSSVMRAAKAFEAEALRDDEWVFSGQSFTDSVWMGADGKLRIGEVDADQRENLWGVGFFHRESRDSFIALYLEHSAEGMPEPKHTGAPTMYYKWHGHLWSRYPLAVKSVPAGAALRQKNAYVALPFTVNDGPSKIEQLRKELSNPLQSTTAKVTETEAKKSGNRLARSGERLSKRLLWEALGDCKDAQLYTADINVVELGLIYDLRVRGSTVEVIMTMPHRGRPRADYFGHGSISVHPTKSVPIRERLLQVEGVREVIVHQVWDPPWSSNFLTDAGREKLGLNHRS
jgi:metal-sulfur cluster biosynthetic enzyme